jgi:hypothetical protein
MPRPRAVIRPQETEFQLTEADRNLHLMNTKAQLQIVGPAINEGFRMVIPEPQVRLLRLNAALLHRFREALASRIQRRSEHCARVSVSSTFGPSITSPQ